MSRKKASILNLIFNYANVAFVIINGILLVPIYLKHFSVSTYGSFLASGNIISMLGLLDGGMSYVLTQKLSSAYSKKESKEFNKIITSGLIITLIISLTIIALSICVTPYISKIVKAENGQFRNIQICFILSTLSACLGIYYNNLSSIFQATLFVHFSGISNLVSIIIGLTTTLLGLYFNIGIVSIPLGFFARTISSCIILMCFVGKVLSGKNRFTFNYDKETLVELIKTSLPMFGGAIAKSLVTNSQLLIINIFINPASSAIYFITSRIFQVCDSFLAPIGSAIYSSISQIHSTDDKIKLQFVIKNIFSLFSIFSMAILSISFLLNESFITLLLGHEKYGGLNLSLLLCISMFFYTRFNFISVNLFALGSFGKTTFYDFMGGIIKLIIIFSLIKYLGLISMPIAELFSTIFISGYFLNKLISKKLEFKKNDVLKFVFSGLTTLLIIIVFNLFWIRFVPAAKNWINFSLYSFYLGIINLIIIIISSKEAKELFINFLINFKKNVKIS